MGQIITRTKCPIFFLNGWTGPQLQEHVPTNHLSVCYGLFLEKITVFNLLKYYRLYVIAFQTVL